MRPESGVTILMADDDEEDQMLIKSAFEEEQLCGDLRFVSDGQELLDYLKRRGAYEDASLSPRPAFILLDLNMPRLDGIGALKQIKADPDLKSIPVIILTTTDSADMIRECYSLGANSFITKPISYGGLVDAVKAVGSYWFDTVMLPHKGSGCR